MRREVGSMYSVMLYCLFSCSSSEVRKLDQDHKRLERTCEVAEKMGVSLQEAHDRLLSVQKRNAEREKKYESQTVILRGLFLEFARELNRNN
jgi:hypothetical protein